MSRVRRALLCGMICTSIVLFWGRTLGRCEHGLRQLWWEKLHDSRFFFDMGCISVLSCVEGRGFRAMAEQWSLKRFLFAVLHDTSVTSLSERKRGQRASPSIETDVGIVWARIWSIGSKRIEEDSVPDGLRGRRRPKLGRACRKRRGLVTDINYRLR